MYKAVGLVMALAKSNLRDLGAHLHGDLALVQHGGGEGQHHPEFLVVDGDGGAAAHPALGHRNGIFAAGQEGGLGAAGGHQVGLRQHPPQIILFENVEEHGPQETAGLKASPAHKVAGIGGCGKGMARQAAHNSSS